MKKTSKYFSETRHELQKFYPPCDKLLDVGCGRGVFSKEIKGIHKCVVHGVEYDQESAKEASIHLDKVYVGDITTLMPEIQNRFYDVIGCNDILEHLYDPYTLLQSLKDKMISNGVLIASIPNFLFIGSFLRIVLKRDFQYSHEGILDFTHVRFFTKKSVIRMFHEAGYEIISLHGINESRNKFWKLFNFITLKYFDDFSYLQYVITAKPIMR